MMKQYCKPCPWRKVPIAIEKELGYDASGAPSRSDGDFLSGAGSLIREACTASIASGTVFNGLRIKDIGDWLTEDAENSQPTGKGNHDNRVLHPRAVGFLLFGK